MVIPFRTFTLTMVLFMLYSGIALHAQVNLKSERWPKYQADIIGEAHHSRYNFTDAVIPYYGLDSWAELRITAWVEPSQKFAPYISIQGSYMAYLPSAPATIPAFFWQRYIQAGAGAQWYPFFDKNRSTYSPAFGIRVFALAMGRKYLNKPKDRSPYSELAEYDMHAGADYYFDNLFLDKNALTITAWSNAAFRLTNFNRKGYNRFLWTGNVKTGKKWHPYRRAIVYPYLLLDWTATFFSPHHNWWENYLHPGAGIRFYPLAYKSKRQSSSVKKEPSIEMFRRLHLFTEYFWEGAWFRERPPARTQKYDLRFGIGFSTPGFNRSRNKEKSR